MSDDVLNDGHDHKTGEVKPHIQKTNTLYNHGAFQAGSQVTGSKPADSGSYSRYFDLDAWYDDLFE